MPYDSTVDHGLRPVERTTSFSLPASPKLLDIISRDQLSSTEQPFDTVARKLKEIGAIHIEDFLSSVPGRSSLRALSTKPIYSDSTNNSTTHSDGLLEGTDEYGGSESLLPESSTKRDSTPGFPPARDNAISRLHQTCIHVFGSVDPLKYEFIEENGQKNKQCILTLTRSDGHSRSYQSEAVFLRRSDAKARVATLAVQMGALDFMLEGSADPGENDGAPQTSSSVTIGGSEAGQPTGPIAPEVLIEKCLLEWRAGKVSAEWIFYNDSRLAGHYGAALRIQLSNHSFHIYSCDSIFKSEADAKTACATKALDEGVIDYIKFGNGQTKPVQPFIEDIEPELFDQQRPSLKGKTRPMTLQAYYESLPQPFPESFGTKTASEINAPGYINTLLQSARGGRLKYNFYWVTDKMTSLMGCLLRLERGELTKTYFVDRIFHKRSDAKSAACLLALSQGLGDYIRSVKASMDEDFTPEMRKLASDKFIFALNTECSKIRQGNRLNFTYSDVLDAFGASLEIDISNNANTPEIRKWIVPAEYRSKSDAKLAVCYHAVSQGAIEVLQFKGTSPPPDHVSYWDVIHGQGTNGTTRVAKRKSTETDVGRETCSQQKKRKKDGQKVNASRSGSVHPGAPAPAFSNSQIGPPVGHKRLPEKRPLHTRLQALNGISACDSKNNIIAGQSQTPGGYGNFGPDTFPMPQTPYYTPPMLSGPQYPFSPPMNTTPPSAYYHTSIPSPIAYTTYHSPSTLPENAAPHPPMYHPPYFPSYPQHPVSPYYAVSSPYHSPYAYPSSSPLYLPQTPEIRMVETQNFHPETYYNSFSHAPLHLMSPPCTPPRPQRIKRIDRNTPLSPLKTADNLKELEDLRTRNEQSSNVATDNVFSPAKRNGESLEPGELTEGEEEEVSPRPQVLERRASMP